MADHPGERRQRLAERVLLALSRELAEARDERELTGAVARALAELFPGRCFALRLLDPATFGVASVSVHGPLRRGRAPVALRRIAIERGGLDEAGLVARGLVVTEEDAPLFEGCVLANAIPLAGPGELLGVLNLEYPAESAGERDRDAPLGNQVANHAALALRNLRSLEQARSAESRLECVRDAAEHAERLAGLGRLVAGVVHELNNPLTAVTMYSDALLEKLTPAGQDPADLEKLRAIREAGLRIQRLARDLVAYAQPGGTRTQALELAAVVDEALRLAKPALKEANAAVVRRFERVPAVEGNRASLTQVFVNLVTNAAQAVGAKGEGTIVVAIARAPDGVVATVEDSGEGLAAEARARAFEPFFTTRPGRGIGLGLPIVQGIVQRHGGAIALAAAPGGGTRVTVTLPVKRE